MKMIFSVIELSNFKKNTFVFLMVFLVLSIVSNTTRAQVGTLDYSFGTNGIVLTDFSNSEEYGETLLSLPDGKILVAGKRYTNGIAIVRYNNDGSIDNTFGVNGKVFTSAAFGNTFGGWYGCALAVQEDGKILIGGSDTANNESNFALIRYSSNGILDNTFGSGGIAAVSIGDFSESIYSITIQTDQKIIVAGRSSIMDYYDYNFALVRFNADGSLDNSFGNSGTIITNLGPFSEAYSVVIQNDDKILVSGTAVDPTSYKYCFAAARYNSNGMLDQTFGNAGVVKTSIDDGAYGQSIHVQADNKILITGFYRTQDLYSFGATRYNVNGSLDLTFGTNGIVLYSFNPNLNFMIGSSAIQQNGKIIVAGYIEEGSNYNMLVARFNSNGSLDLNFGTSGFTTIPTNSTYLTPFGGQGIGYGISVDIDVNEKILVAGNSNVNLNPDFILCRLNGDGVNETILNDQMKQEIKLFPNPTNDIVRISSNAEIINSISIINSYGKTINEFQINDLSLEVNLKDLPAGLYYVLINTDFGRVSKQIIKN
jgi:uncharacterized delta-60 repeat protein